MANDPYAELGVARDATPEAITLQFNAQPITSPAVILKFAQSRRDTSFAGQDRLRIKVATTDVISRSRLVREILTSLQPAVGQLSDRLVAERG